MITGYTDSQNRFRPTGFVPVIHPSIKNSFNQNEPKDSKSQRAKGIAKLLGNKTVALGKKAHEKKIQHDEKRKEMREDAVKHLNTVLENDRIPNRLKIHAIQQLLIDNKKNLSKSDMKLYNQRLRELYQQVLTPPTLKAHDPLPEKNDGVNHAQRLLDESRQNYGDPQEHETRGGFDYEMGTTDEPESYEDVESMKEKDPDDKLDIYAKASAIH